MLYGSEQDKMHSLHACCFRAVTSFNWDQISLFLNLVVVAVEVFNLFSALLKVFTAE